MEPISQQSPNCFIWFLWILVYKGNIERRHLSLDLFKPVEQTDFWGTLCMRIHMNKTNLKRLGLYEILLGKHFDHWIPVLGTPKECSHQSNLDFLSLTLLMNTLVLGLNIENTAFLYLLKFPVSFSNLSWTKWVFITYANSMWTFCHRLNRHSIVKHLLQFFKECDTQISICHIIWPPYFNFSFNL